MSLPRAAILPGTSLPLAAPPDVSVTSLGRIAQGERWRTEAMRSYQCPVLIWVTRGQGRITMAGQRRGYNPFTLIFLPPRTMHGFDRMGPVAGSVVFLPRNSELTWPDAPLHVRIGDTRKQMELTQQLDALEREAAGDGLERDTALRCMAGLLAVWLARELNAQVPPAPKAEKNGLVAAYSAMVERDFADGGTVADLARSLGITPTHLTRVCRASSGISAHELLSNRRHFEARRLLLDTDLPMADVARQAGFKSAAYFSRTFRSATGQTPRAFRASGAAR